VNGAALSPGQRLASYFPILGWARNYPREWLGSDALSGLTLAAYAIPNSIAYAMLAGLSSQTGLYAYLVCGLAYAIFGTSRSLAIGPTSAISLSMATALGALAPGDPARAAALASMTALLVAAMCFGAWALRGGGIVHFISDTVLIGFKIGAGLVIAATQLPRLFGIAPASGGFVPSLRYLAEHIGETNVASLALGAFAIVFLVMGRKLFPRWPVSLTVVALSIALMYGTDLASSGVRTCGEIAQGLPSFGLALASPSEIEQLLPVAFACFLLAYVEGISAARALAVRRGERIDPNQELLALGAANLAGGLSQSYPAAGGLGQSAVNHDAGARTPLSLVFASSVFAIALLFLTGIFARLPQAILAALVLAPMRGLIQIEELPRLARVSRRELAIAIAAIAGVLVLGILPGVMIAAVLSLVFLLQRAANPAISILGRWPGSEDYRDVERHPNCRGDDSVLIIRPNAPLVYFNVDVVSDTVLDLALKRETKPRLVVLDLSYTPEIDISAGHALAELRDELTVHGVEVRLAEVHHKTRLRLVDEGLEAAMGAVDRRKTIAEVVDGRSERYASER
jgi:sulfate permease, SulP family